VVLQVRSYDDESFCIPLTIGLFALFVVVTFAHAFCPLLVMLEGPNRRHYYCDFSRRLGVVVVLPCLQGFNNSLLHLLLLGHGASFVAAWRFPTFLGLGCLFGFQFLLLFLWQIHVGSNDGRI
jgi:hypothetical protein